MANLAINGGTPVRTNPISKWPIFDEKEKDYLLKILETGIWCKIGGEMNNEFEKKFSEFQNVKYTVTVCNGTVAIRIALFAAGIGPGDEVIIPSYTFIATASAVVEANAIPVLADIDEDNFNISPESIKSLITEKTKAIMPVHFAGAPANMDEIMKIAKQYNLTVIEDAAQAQGSKWNGKRVGAIGNAGTFSFQQSKNITSGEGGAIVTNDDLIEERIRSFHNCGRKIGQAWYYHFNMGGNYRLSELQAAILLAQLEREENHIKKRTENAKYLDQLLSKELGVEPVIYSDKTESSYYLYIAKYNTEMFNNVPKLKFVQALNAEGISAIEGYPFPIYNQPVLKEKKFWNHGCPENCSYYGNKIDYANIKHPVAEKACKEGFWFPNTVLHGSKSDIESIVKAINKIKKYSFELEK
jgi:dTDP-4-amino-4,6-dideoxygalactose transaminase